jgi:hypothetical protein
MATLNRAETQALNDVVGVLYHFMIGDIPEDKRAEIARIARDKVKTVVTMKGHYDT